MIPKKPNTTSYKSYKEAREDYENAKKFSEFEDSFMSKMLGKKTEKFDSSVEQDKKNDSGKSVDKTSLKK